MALVPITMPWPARTAQGLLLRCLLIQPTWSVIRWAIIAGLCESRMRYSCWLLVPELISPGVGNLFWAGGRMKIKIVWRAACYFVLIIQNSRPDQTISVYLVWPETREKPAISISAFPLQSHGLTLLLSKALLYCRILSNNNTFIHSFILNIYIAPLQENYSEAQ